jgi:putative phosphoribosyl transferase
MFAFRDRAEAGRKLAIELAEYRDQANVIVLALPRGGVPVGHEIATALHVPLDVLVVRKLGFPGNPELAMGAIAGGGVRILNPQVLASLHMPGRAIESIVANEEAELQRREALYRRGKPPLNVRGKTVLLTDDGIATGSTMLAAIRALRNEGAGAIVVAVPVASRGTAEKFASVADKFVCLLKPEEFAAIGEWYEDFSQLSDNDVIRLSSAATGEDGREERISA